MITSNLQASLRLATGDVPQLPPRDEMLGEHGNWMLFSTFFAEILYKKKCCQTVMIKNVRLYITGRSSMDFRAQI